MSLSVSTGFTTKDQNVLLFMSLTIYSRETLDDNFPCDKTPKMILPSAPQKSQKKTIFDVLYATLVCPSHVPDSSNQSSVVEASQELKSRIYTGGEPKLYVRGEAKCVHSLHSSSATGPRLRDRSFLASSENKWLSSTTPFLTNSF